MQQPSPTLHPSIISIQKTAALTLLLVATLAVSSCVSSAAKNLVDPTFATYEPQAETNPSRNAILGMWNRTETMTFGLADESRTKLSISMLFRPDGTCLAKSKMKSEMGVTDIPASSHRWHYLGGGKWAPEAATSTPGVSNWYRVAGNKLLQYSDTPHGNIRHVYSRVE